MLRRRAEANLAEIAERALSGYRRYPWGGLEIGGVLFGRNVAGTIHICSVRTADCEHLYGPEFDLSPKDCEAFEQLLAAPKTDQELAGLSPVGWYHSTSRRDLALSEHGRDLFHRFFPEPWQIAMMLTRSKRDPLSVALFLQDLRGRTELHSPAQEFTLDAFTTQPPSVILDSFESVPKGCADRDSGLTLKG